MIERATRPTRDEEWLVQVALVATHLMVALGLILGFIGLWTGIKTGLWRAVFWSFIGVVANGAILLLWGVGIIGGFD